MWIFFFFALVLQWFPQHKAHRSGFGFYVLSNDHVLEVSPPCTVAFFLVFKSASLRTKIILQRHLPAAAVTGKKEQDVDSGLSFQIRIGLPYQLSVALGKGNCLKQVKAVLRTHQLQADGFRTMDRVVLDEMGMLTQCFEVTCCSRHLKHTH